MTNPLVSVVIPVYNKAEYIERSINSVYAQTFSDYEIVIIDDSSTDGSSEIIESLYIKDESIRKFKRDTPGPGGYAARNLGIKKARGKLIAFLDADDIWFPKYLEEMVRLSIKYPQAKIFSCSWLSKRDNNVILDPFTFRNRLTTDKYFSIDDYLSHAAKGETPICTICACIRRGLDEVDPPFFPSETAATRGGDLHAWLKAVIYSGGLAWSSYIGAQYTLGVVGQVSSGRPANLALYHESLLLPFEKRLTKRQNSLFNNYINYRLKNIILARKKKKMHTRDILALVRWRNSFISAFKILLIHLIPSAVLSVIRFTISKK